MKRNLKIGLVYTKRGNSIFKILQTACFFEYISVYKILKIGLYTPPGSPFFRTPRILRTQPNSKNRMIPPGNLFLGHKLHFSYLKLIFCYIVVRKLSFLMFISY